MNIEFTARRIKLAPEVKEIAEKKLSKLEKVLPRGAEAHFIIKSEKKGVSVEITVTGGQRTWTATESGDDQEAVTLLVLDHIALQAKKTKSKIREDKKHRPSPVRGVELAPPPEAREKPAARGPRREAVSTRPMFEEDALSKFAASDREVLVYRDPSDEGFRVLYRRRDGSLGLLIPS